MNLFSAEDGTILTSNESTFPRRQVHLDFHTSPLIPDVAREFDARQFARTFKRANVNSVTVFAKCHHGMCYYPTKVGTPHPAIGTRDLLGEMIEALHRERIRCPIYLTVGWEEESARTHPEWLQQRRDGTFARINMSGDPGRTQPGGWWFLNFLHPDYQDLIEAHVRELLGAYDVDGFFFDILFFDPSSCWSSSARQFRERHGFLANDAATQARFESAAQRAFARRFTRLIHGRLPRATVVYNSPNYTPVDGSVGLRARARFQTHGEIESLPSGFWGYHHFPRLARMVGHWGQPWLGMTGRFQKMWGDFGGIKPQPALEYECFRAQALGGGNSVGDQLPPRGTLDAAAYELIGAVYAQCADAEPFYAGSTSLSQVGILTPHHPSVDSVAADKSLEGAVLMCEEAHYDCAVLDDGDAFNKFDLLILPDTTVITPKLLPKLKLYLRRGGKMLASFRSAPSFLSLRIDGEVEEFPTYWRARDRFMPEGRCHDRVCYAQGLNVTGVRGTRTLIDRVLPYFKRTDLHYSSHYQTPPRARVGKYAAVIEGNRFIYFADPIFREVRQTGNLAVRDTWRAAMQRLIGPPPFGAGLPTTILCVPRRRANDLLLTLLHYVPIRKSLDIDVIEERMSFGGESLRLPTAANRVRLHGGGDDLPRNADGSFKLPPAKGRLLLEVPRFFARR
jgi:hypothetical protein